MPTLSEIYSLPDLFPFCYILYMITLGLDRFCHILSPKEIRKSRKLSFVLQQSGTFSCSFGSIRNTHGIPNVQRPGLPFLRHKELRGQDRTPPVQRYADGIISVSVSLEVLSLRKAVIPMISGQTGPGPRRGGFRRLRGLRFQVDANHSNAGFPRLVCRIAIIVRLVTERVITTVFRVGIALCFSIR